jgi:hypothetical protein
MDKGLAKRLVACKGWRWMPGMCWASPVYGTEGRIEDDDEAETFNSFLVGYLPDLSDPLTVQAVLLLVREAWGDIQFIITYSPWAKDQWCLEAVFYSGANLVPYRDYYRSSSLAEACVNAMEAAHEKTVDATRAP